MVRTLSTKIDNNRVTVSSAGTAVQFDTDAHILRSIMIQALDTNQGKVFIGGSAVSATRGIYMAPGAVIELSFTGDVPLSDFWVDAANANDVVDWFAEFK